MITLVKTAPRNHGVSLNGYTFLATSTYGSMMVFSHDYSDEIKVYAYDGGWLVNDDPDFSRFLLAEDTATHGKLIDLVTGIPHEILWVGGDQ